MNRAALYARVSTKGKGQDPEMQVREMLDYAARRHWTAEVFADPGWSGAKESRPQLDRMMQACRRGKFDVVIVYRFDRFARSMKQLVNALDELNHLGVQFVSLHENVDTTTPQGRLVFGIFAAIAEFERELTRDSITSALEMRKSALKKQGYFISKSGHRRTSMGRPRVFVSESKIKALRDSGASWRAIAEELGVGIGTAYRASQRSDAHVAERQV